jgi:diguanylate cyclase (GGDEF)-like protein
MGAIEGSGGDALAALSTLAVTPDDTAVLADLLARPRPAFVSVDTPEPFVAALLELTGLIHVAIVPMVSAGEFYGVVVAGVTEDPTRLEDDDDVVERLTGVALHGATALRNAALVDQIRHQALHDDLTGLPNQRLLEDRVAQALEQARRDGVRTGLLFIDLDGFKAVNDSLGHAAGDETLRQVAHRITGALRLSDTVARLGGDEFAVLLPRLSQPACAEEVAAKLGELLSEPFHVHGHDVSLGASIGAAVYPDRGVTFAELLRAADAAMYVEKRRGRATPAR